MDIKAQYVLQSKLSFYQTPRFYEDTSSKNKKPFLRKFNPKKMSVFQEIIKAHSKIPGVGKYTINTQQKQKQTKKSIKKQESSSNKPRESYLDSLLKRSMSLPSVGKYNIIIKKKIKKGPSKGQNIKGCRPTVFDSLNPDNVGTAPGNYQFNKKILSTSPKYSISPEHKRKFSLPKIPSPGDYNPVPSSFSTFQKKSKEFQQLQNGIKIPTFGVRKSQKLLVKSPGPVYNLISDWGKKVAFKSEFNVYKSISLPKKQSIYNSPNTAR